MYAVAQKEDKGLVSRIRASNPAHSTQIQRSLTNHCVSCAIAAFSGQGGGGVQVRARVERMYSVLPNSSVDSRLNRVCFQVPHEALRRDAQLARDSTSGKFAQTLEPSCHSPHSLDARLLTPQPVVARSWPSTCRWRPTRRSRARHPTALALPFYDPSCQIRSLTPIGLLACAQVQGGRPRGHCQLRGRCRGLHHARLPWLRRGHLGPL